MIISISNSIWKSFFKARIKKENFQLKLMFCKHNTNGMITYIFQHGEYNYQIVQFNPHQSFAIYHGDSLIGELDYNGENWFQNSGSKLPQSVIEAIGRLIENQIK